MITIIFIGHNIKKRKLFGISAITEKEFNKRKSFKTNYWTYYQIIS